MKIVVGLIVVGMLAGCVVSKIVEQRPVRLSGSQVNAIEESAKYSLIDPNSAMFRNIRAKEIKREDGTQAVEFCGEVNAKNRMGGYSGFSAFKGKLEPGKPLIEFMDSSTDTYGNAAMICSTY